MLICQQLKSQWEVRAGSVDGIVCSSSEHKASWQVTESEANEQAGLGFGVWWKWVHHTRILEIEAQMWAAKFMLRHGQINDEEFWACDSHHSPFDANV